METLANGFVTLTNGMLTLLSGVVTPVGLMTGIVAASWVWIALVELDELNRQGSKPEIGRGL